MGFGPDLGGPPRDTGLMLEGRAARERRRRQRERRKALLIAAAVVAIIVAVGWFLAHTAPRSPMPVALASGGTALVRASDSPSGGPASVPLREPTPIFAAFQGIVLHVPVPAEKLTEIAFHQASFDYAQHLVTRLPTYPMERAKDKRGTRRGPVTNVADSNGWLEGSVLRLWRTRPGRPDSAADVGAPAGSPVLAPVDGRVLLVKAYRLYGKYPDFEVHIRPGTHEDVDVVLIHVTSPTVAAGDAVVGGVTQVGSVRMLSSKMNLQLADYTAGPGDHTHVQVNHVKLGTTEATTAP